MKGIKIYKLRRSIGTEVGIIRHNLARGSLYNEPYQDDSTTFQLNRKSMDHLVLCCGYWPYLTPYIESIPGY